MESRISYIFNIEHLLRAVKNIYIKGNPKARSLFKFGGAGVDIIPFGGRV